jgi:hypothetical protein
MPRRCLGSILLSLGVFSLLGACATGAEDGLGGLSGAYSAGPADDPAGGGSEGEDTEGETDESPPTSAGGSMPPGDGSSGGEDVGNPLCCEVHAVAGCDSEVTESCVCTSRPECCQEVWTNDCVELAIACGDPFCTDDSGGGSTGDPPDEPPPDEPPPDEPPPDEPPPDDPPPDDPPLYEDCPCLNQPGVDNFCHYGPSYPGCPMTTPGGYCDPNGDASFVEGNWVLGYDEWHAQCT